MADTREPNEIDEVDLSVLEDPNLTSDSLDLDELEAPHLPVTIAGEVYPMTGKGDLSMADREEMRRIMVHLSELQELPEGVRNLSKSQRAIFEDLEYRLCKLALPTAPDKVLKALSPKQRNTLVDRFFVEADVAAMIRSFVQTAHRMQQQTTKPATPLRPLRPEKGTKPPMPPADLVGPRPFSSTTESATGT